MQRLEQQGGGSGFLDPLITTRYAPEGIFTRKKHALCLPHSYDIGEHHSGRRITVPAGFITDFASWHWPRGKYENASVLHDFLYWKNAGVAIPQFSRKRCDEIFYEAMLVAGVPKWLAKTMYLGVRIGGWVPFNWTIPGAKASGVKRIWLGGADYIAEHFSRRF